MALLKLLLSVVLIAGPAAAEPRTRIVPAQGGQSDSADNNRKRGVSQAVRPPSHVGIVRDPAVVQSIGARQKVEIVPNQSYWNTVGQVRYNHYYDGRAHWYGFHHGPSFYWTRFHGGWWWWYDPFHTRWTYWSDGRWWWHGPAGATYVYVNNAYQPVQEPPALRPTVPPPVETPPAVPEEVLTGSWKSPDGKRLVQINGADQEAFLYDATGESPAFLKYLGKEVTKARFSGGKDGKPLKVMLDFKDGSFRMFDKDGKPTD